MVDWMRRAPNIPATNDIQSSVYARDHSVSLHKLVIVGIVSGGDSGGGIGGGGGDDVVVIAHMISLFGLVCSIAITAQNPIFCGANTHIYFLFMLSFNWTEQWTKWTRTEKNEIQKKNMWRKKKWKRELSALSYTHTFEFCSEYARMFFSLRQYTYYYFMLNAQPCASVAERYLPVKTVIH